MNFTLTSRFRAILAVAALTFVVQSCVEDVNPDITPVANLTFTVTASGQPVEGAVVYLFPFQSIYQSYLTDNPSGSDQITPNVTAENVAVTNAAGQAFFSNKPLDGTSYASGTTFIHRPNPIYFRIQATRPGPVYLTNDDDVFRISFQEIGSGSVVDIDTDVELQ